MELKWDFPKILEENKYKKFSTELGLPLVVGKIL